MKVVVESALFLTLVAVTPACWSSEATDEGVNVSSTSEWQARSRLSVSFGSELGRVLATPWVVNTGRDTLLAVAAYCHVDFLVYDTPDQAGDPLWGLRRRGCATPEGVPLILPPGDSVVVDRQRLFDWDEFRGQHGAGTYHVFGRLQWNSPSEPLHWQGVGTLTVP